MITKCPFCKLDLLKSESAAEVFSLRCGDRHATEHYFCLYTNRIYSDYYEYVVRYPNGYYINATKKLPMTKVYTLKKLGAVTIETYTPLVDLDKLLLKIKTIILFS